MSIKEVVVRIAAAMLVGAPVLVIVERIWNKKGIGARAIQFCAMIMITSLILILALFDVVSTETTAALIGAMTGYVLSGIGSYEPPQRNRGAEKRWPLQESSADNADGQTD